GTRTPPRCTRRQSPAWLHDTGTPGVRGADPLRRAARRSVQMKGLPMRIRIAVVIGAAFAVACALLFASAFRRGPAHRGGSFSALGFELGTTTVRDVERWARDRGVACETKQARTYVECGRVPASMLGESAMLGATGVWFRFDASGALSSLQ